MTATMVPLFCPSCTTRYEVAATMLAERDPILLCGICGTASRFSDARHARTPHAAPSAVDVGPRVVIGHEHPGASRTIAAVLRQAGFSPVCVTRGDQVLSAFDPTMPDRPVACCLDVGIPNVLAFEVIAHLRAHPRTARVPVVLLASVFERTRYKRRPNQLYGADAYLELHHVPDRLGEMLRALIAREDPGQERIQAPSERAFAAPLRDGGLLSDVDATRVRARRLLMDVALYNGDEITRGVRQGDPFIDVRAAIDEAREKLVGEARDPHAAGTIFDEEVAAFRDRLSERERGRRSADG